MSLVKDRLETLRSSLESITGDPTFTGRLDDEDRDRDAFVHLDDGNPWVITKKERQFNIVIDFRFKLDGIDPGTPYFEDDAQGQVYDWIIQLITFPIAGVTLSHNKTIFQPYDEQGRYMGSVLFDAVFSEVNLCS